MTWLVVAIGPRRPVAIRATGKTAAAGMRSASRCFPARTAAVWVFRGGGGRLVGLYVVRGNRARKINPDPLGGRVSRAEWRRFKTGMSYRDVYSMLWSADASAPETWHYKRRGTVLGMWHRIKLEMWAHANQRPDEPGMLVVDGGSLGVDAADARAALRGARLVEVEDDDLGYAFR
jgi:hypothetical protein